LQAGQVQCVFTPGITGLWQVSGRNNLTFKERNQLEVWYIKNWSLWADFVILIKTIKVVMGKVGAK
jgi:undecaprenyl-phosphate galactose phosphotransferase